MVPITLVVLFVASLVTATPPACFLSCLSQVAAVCLNLSDLSCLCSSQDCVIPCLENRCPGIAFLSSRDHYWGTCMEHRYDIQSNCLVPVDSIFGWHEYEVKNTLIDADSDTKYDGFIGEASQANEESDPSIKTGTQKAPKSSDPNSEMISNTSSELTLKASSIPTEMTVATQTTMTTQSMNFAKSEHKRRGSFRKSARLFVLTVVKPSHPHLEQNNALSTEPQPFTSYSESAANDGARAQKKYRARMFKLS